MNTENKNPVVTVVMPAYNCELYIEESIRSVMAQTYKDWELLVIDDCSTDSTRSIIQAISKEDDRIKLIENPQNVGVAKTRNKGFELSKGDYVALLDSDDIWMPEKLEKQLSLIEKTGADLVYTSYAIVNSDRKISRSAYKVPETTSFGELLKENVIGCSTVLISSEIAKKYQFIEDYYHEDYCLWLNLLRDGYKVIGCPEVLVEWRFMSNSRSFDKRNSAVYRWKIYREYLNLPFAKSVKLFSCYFVGGIKKYYS